MHTVLVPPCTTELDEICFGRLKVVWRRRWSVGY